MTACRWDADAKDYLADGQPCRHDEYGDPTRHCTARRTCAQHVGWRELTCARCLGRTRQDIRTIADLAVLMPYEALADGVTSEAANIAGPSTDVRSWSERRVAMKAYLLTWEARGKITEKAYLRARSHMEDDDELDPDSLLNRWHMMLAEDYGHQLPRRMTLGTAVAYLDRVLGKVAQDEGQDFPLLHREVRKCRQHMEAVLRNSQTAEQGAPCPECVKGGGVDPSEVRLRRQYAHWCEDEDCERMHANTEDADTWHCPRVRIHWWTAAGYANLIEERRAHGAPESQRHGLRC